MLSLGGFSVGTIQTCLRDTFFLAFPCQQTLWRMGSHDIWGSHDQIYSGSGTLWLDGRGGDGLFSISHSREKYDNHCKMLNDLSRKLQRIITLCIAQWKCLQISIVHCQNITNITFILQETAMETQLVMQCEKHGNLRNSIQTEQRCSWKAVVKRVVKN